MMDCCPDAGATLTRVEVRRQKIMAAARKLFIANGFHATGMAQIAKGSGVAIGQIYRDFASKEEIVAAMVEADCGRLMMYEKLELAIAEHDISGVRAWLREFVEPSDDPDDARLFAEIVAEASRSDRIRTIFRAIQDELRSHMEHALELIGPGEALSARRMVLREVVSTLSAGMMQQQMMRPELDLSDVLRGVQAVLERELDLLAEASRRTPGTV